MLILSIPEYVIMAFIICLSFYLLISGIEKAINIWSYNDRKK